MKRLPYVRRREILEILKEQDHIDLSELSKQFDVSYMTIHRDIEYLEKNGEVSRVYGGVVRADEEGEAQFQPQPQPQSQTNFQSVDLTIEERFHINLESKAAIAKKACSFIEDGDVIGMDAGTTILHMCGYLNHRNITVVTNSISVALQFSTSQTVNVILLGGNLRKASLTMIGPLVQQQEKFINLNKCFISSKALSFEEGLTDVTMEEPEAKKSLIRRSKEVFVLADHTKVNEVSSYMVCGHESISHIITDSEEIMTKEQMECLNNYKSQNVEVVIVNPRKGEK